MLPGRVIGGVPTGWLVGLPGFTVVPPVSSGSRFQIIAPNIGLKERLVHSSDLLH